MWLAWCPGRKACPFFKPLLRNVLFEKEIRITICWMYWYDLRWRHRHFLPWQHRSWECVIVCLEADIQIISFSFWLSLGDYGYFCLAGSVQQAQQVQTHSNLTFVWLAVSGKPSSQPIWLKVITHCNLTYRMQPLRQLKGKKGALSKTFKDGKFIMLASSR